MTRMNWIKIGKDHYISLDAFYDVTITGPNHYQRKYLVKLKHKYKKDVYVNVEFDSIHEARGWIAKNLLKESKGDAAM